MVAAASVLAASELVWVVATQSARPCPPALGVVAAAVAERFGDSLDAVLFYGSCLRSNHPAEGVVDVYALVNRYERAYHEHYLRWLNALLPPNVFYLERTYQDSTLRIKCTVFSVDAFEHGIRHWFHPYLWGRFAQPVRLLRARNDAVRERIHWALAAAVTKFLARSARCLRGPFTLETVWMEGLRRSYTTELRAERYGRAAELFTHDRDDYRARTHAASAELGWRWVGDICHRGRVPGSGTIATARFAWRLRRWQGRVLSILRLIKISITFKGGVDYAAWKLERHTGIHIELTPRLRRYPLIFAWPVIFRLLRRGALH